MPLTVLNVPVPTPASDLLRFFGQAQLQWFSYLGDEILLDYGRWIPAGGRLADARLLPDLNANQLIEQTTTLAAKHEIAWQRCSLNASITSQDAASLGDALIASGWNASPLEVFYRKSGKSTPLIQIPGLTIIPARASYRHFTQLMQQRGDADAALAHLDDSHLDALLALQDGQAVGSISLLTSGQVGTVREWYVAPAQRRVGIGRLLLQRVLEICNRASLPHVMIGIESSASPARSVAVSEGFASIGQSLNFSRNI